MIIRISKNKNLPFVFSSSSVHSFACAGVGWSVLLVKKSEIFIKNYMQYKIYIEYYISILVAMHIVYELHTH